MKNAKKTELQNEIREEEIREEEIREEEIREEKITNLLEVTKEVQRE